MLIQIEKKKFLECFVKIYWTGQLHVIKKNMFRALESRVEKQKKLF